ncbi:TPA: Dynein beta chain, flagellar outer arm [Trebouxia sp. C0004]
MQAVKPPAKFKRKTVYFIKNQKTSLNAENIKKNVTYGDFAESPLETLSTLSQEVILPVLSNPMNRSGWPDVVSKEVTENLHKFIANVFVTIGQVKGQTLLPLPPSDVAPQEPVVLHDKDKIHILEGAVITWTRQIKDVLKADSESALKEPNTYPGPLTEVDFWTERAANLNSIHQQLSTERVKKVAKVLELVKSTYYPAFNRLLKDVNTACLEANDTVKYLKPLRKYLEKMNSMDDFTALIELFKPMFHTMLLIWKHSGYYNTSAKMVTLIREMCNDLIMQACKFVPGPELMQMEPQEAVDKLRQTVRVLSAFKSYYFDNKARTLEETPNNPWKFQNSALFGRLDGFLDRCNDVLNLSQTALQFHKLERVEVGGTKGKTLTNSVKQIFTDFLTAAEKFQKLNYDAMNVDATQFADDFATFCGVIRELERRLGAVIAQAFDDCTTVASIFKLLDSFEGLLDRGVIAADLERKHLDLVNGYGQDLKEVADMFRETREDPPLNKNAAPHSGRVTWVRGLKERVAGPMEKLHSLPKLVLDSEEARSVQQQYDHLIVEMDQFEKATVEDWCNLISAISDQKLKQPLMSQDPQGNVLRVNFDPALVRLLRETRYFLLLPDLPIEIPANALKIYERDVMFRQQVGNLQLIVGIYNNVQATILPVEKPLIMQKLEAVDAALKKGLQTLNWNSHHIDDYIMEVMALVRDVNETLATIKGNVKRTSEVLAGWVANPMFDRKEGKVHTYEELTNSFRDVSSKCHSLISDGGKEITKLLSSSNRTLKVSKGAPAWKAYVDYIGDVVIDGLVECIIASVHRLTSQVDPENMAKHEIAPLLEIQLELIVPDIVWVPELGSGGAPGVRDMFSKWFKSFLEIATLIKRLDTGEGNYAKELEEDYIVYDAISEVQGILGANEIKCNALKAQYSKYGYLWKRDLNETLKEFLVAEGKQLEDGTRDDPTLDRFEAEIAKYRAVQEEIQAVPTSATIGYIKIDAKPIKQALTTWVTKWIYLFTHYLQIKVVSSMEELYKFMNQSNATLDLKVGSELATEPLPEGEVVEGADNETLKAAQAEENRKSLYSIMSCMRDVRKRSDKTDNMFEPLRDTVSLLTKFSITVTDVVLKQLEEGPLAWKSLKKKMFQRREILAPLQQAEAIDIRRKSDSFGEKVEDFRKFFQQKAPFNVPGAELKLEHVRPAYLVLDAFHHGQVESHMSVTKIMADSEYLRECQDLFELYVSDYIMLTRCKEELGYLKALWDMVGAVMFTFTDWYATLWDKIDVDFLVEETKKLTKDIKQLNKAVRNYEVYRLLEERLKAMLTSLPLVSDLHHPAMRERHWKQLMKATGKNFIMDSKFNLGNLLELGLHNYVDACSEIVDRAQKELIIEKALKKIDETWSLLSLTFSPYQDTDNVQMTVEDSITEALETDNLALQTMSGGKYVQGNPKFLEIVTNWQKKLGTVDVVLNTWLDVQKKWQALESIFVGSADIRVQLPEDSKRFDVVNADFQASC